MRRSASVKLPKIPGTPFWAWYAGANRSLTNQCRFGRVILSQRVLGTVMGHTRYCYGEYFPKSK